MDKTRALEMSPNESITDAPGYSSNLNMIPTITIDRLMPVTAEPKLRKKLIPRYDSRLNTCLSGIEFMINNPNG
jgi:hypothetical protein